MFEDSLQGIHSPGPSKGRHRKHAKTPKNTSPAASDSQDDSSEDEDDGPEETFFQFADNPQDTMAGTRRSATKSSGTTRSTSTAAIAEKDALVAKLKAQLAEKEEEMEDAAEVGHDSQEFSLDLPPQLKKKHAKKKKAGDMAQLICDRLKAKGWRSIKFINCPEAQAHATRKLIPLMEIKELDGEGEDDATAQRTRERWAEAWGPVVTGKLNKLRNYVQSQIRKNCCLPWMRANGGEDSLPELEVLKKFCKREKATDAAELKIFRFIWDKLLAAVAMEQWKPDRKQRNCPKFGAAFP